MRYLLAFIAVFPLTLTSAFAASFNYDIEITSISGAGQAENIGFFSTGSVGDAGIGGAEIEDGLPTDYPGTLEASRFTAVFPGVASAATFAQKTLVHDPSAGKVTVSGFLGGITGPYTAELFASNFEFVFTGEVGGPIITSNSGLNSFLDGASMSGYFVGFFVLNGDFNNQYYQAITFEGAVSEIPLPASAMLLLTALGLSVATRRHRR